jgi:hypothetical protein
LASDAYPGMNTQRRKQVLTAAAAVGGLALFAWSVRDVGADQILTGVHRVGWGLLLILTLAGVRFLLRAEAWRLCTPVTSRLRLRQAFLAFLAGDALGNITPLGLIASEPTKVFLIRHEMATSEAVASLAVDNLVYALSVVAMIAIGVSVMLATVTLPFEAQEWGIAALVVLAVIGLASLRLFRPRRRRAAADDGQSLLARLSRMRDMAMTFSAGHPRRLWRAFVFDVLFHAVAVLEAYVTLQWLLGDRSPTFVQAVMFESLYRVVTVVFKFVPLRVGVDEAISGAFAPIVGLTPAAGVALAVIRKVRGLFWMGVGLLFIAVSHGPTAQARTPPESVPAHRT